MTEADPQQGEVYLVRALRAIGDTKKRPVAVVSINSRNELSRTVLIVPFTSDLRGGNSDSDFDSSRGWRVRIRLTHCLRANFSSPKNLSGTRPLR
jgi:mRNA-degrading endonuclease toxin of MazEF toxin-antitoxin module